MNEGRDGLFGKTSVQASKTQSPDVACAACGAISLAAESGKYDMDLDWVGTPTVEAEAEAARRFQEARFNHHVLRHSGYFQRRRWF
jgi:hypothetical protein